MTTEIAILNKQAVALATDSAVSSPNKIFQSANKIFSLSKFAPVAIMVYSRADFCGVPWETIIKSYRNNLGSIKFNTLDEYAYNFIDFITNNDTLMLNIIDEKLFVREVIHNFSLKIIENIQNIASSESKKEGHLSQLSIDNIIRHVFERNFHSIEKAPPLSIRASIDKKLFFSKFNQDIDDLYKKYIECFSNSIDNLYNNFRDSIFNLLTCAIFPLGYSGIVFAGFGEKQLFPSVRSFLLGGFVFKHLQFIEDTNKNTSINHQINAAIVPFAQDDIISMFVEGIHPEIRNNMLETFTAILKEQTESIIKIFNISNRKKNLKHKELMNFQETLIKKLFDNMPIITNDFVYPTIDTISILPPNELANLAESLINLTSIKRQVSLDRETVGGPTDVALISKGDGLIWIKRKHYFDSSLNHHFFNNYFQCGEPNGKDIKEK